MVAIDSIEYSSTPFNDSLKKASDSIEKKNGPYKHERYVCKFTKLYFNVHH